MDKLHLAIVGQNPPFNPERFDFAWNADFSAYRPLRLKWWDDASYIAYQCGDIDDSDDAPEFVGESAQEPSDAWYESRVSDIDDNDIPF